MALSASMTSRPIASDKPSRLRTAVERARSRRDSATLGSWSALKNCSHETQQQLYPVASGTNRRHRSTPSMIAEASTRRTRLHSTRMVSGFPGAIHFSIIQLVAVDEQIRAFSNVAVIPLCFWGKPTFGDRLQCNGRFHPDPLQPHPSRSRPPAVDSSTPSLPDFAKIG